MRRFMRGIIYSILFVIALLYFFPKAPLFYFVERQIEPFGVLINEEAVNGGFTLRILGSTWYVKEIKSAEVAAIELSPWLVYNALHIRDVNVSSAAASFIPTHLDTLHVSHSLLAPLQLHLKATGDFGEASGRFTLDSRELNITVIPSSIMSKKYRSSMRMLRRNSSGEYHYDKRF